MANPVAAPVVTTGGKLSLVTPSFANSTTKPATKSSSMPLDATGQIALQQAAAARSSYLDQIQQQQEQEESNYQDQLHDMNLQHPIDVRDLLNNYSGRGMAFSSGYGDAAGQLANTYGTNLSRLAAARSQALGGFASDKSDYNKEYGVDLSGIRQAAADRLAANAASLGLSSTKGKTITQLLEGN